MKLRQILNSGFLLSYAAYMSHYQKSNMSVMSKQHCSVIFNVVIVVLYPNAY